MNALKGVKLVHLKMTTHLLQLGKNSIPILLLGNQEQPHLVGSLFKTKALFTKIWSPDFPPVSMALLRLRHSTLLIRWHTNSRRALLYSQAILIKASLTQLWLLKPCHFYLRILMILQLRALWIFLAPLVSTLPMSSRIFILSRPRWLIYITKDCSRLSKSVSKS